MPIACTNLQNGNLQNIIYFTLVIQFDLEI